MDDFTQDENLKMSEENLWLVHGREDASYKTSWAQRRLLEKKNARKRKQEEASAALKNIDLQSNAKKSPVKNRYPLSPKNDNDSVGAKLPPIAKPRTDISPTKRSTPHGKDVSPSKRSASRGRVNSTGKSPGRDLEEILDSGRKSQVFTSSRHGSNEAKNQLNSIQTESESIKERMARFQNKSQAQDDDISNRKVKQRTEEKRSSSRSNSGNGTPTGKVERSSGSISDRMAIFETSGKSTGSGSRNSAKSSEQRSTYRSSQSSEDKSKYISNSSSSSHRLSAKVKKTSTMKEPNGNEKEIKTPLTPQLDSIGNVDESCDFDYNSDENPFDVSSILRAANEGEPHGPEAAEYAKASWNVMDYMMGDSPKIDDASNEGRQRESVYSNYGADESMSGFAKEIAKKRKAIKSPHQESSIKMLDLNLNEKALNMVQEDRPRVQRVEEKPRSRVPEEETKMERKEKRGKKDEKRKAPKFPGEDEAKPKHNDKKMNRNEKAFEEDKVRGRSQEAPPKPPRKGKSSVEEYTENANMEASSGFESGAGDEEEAAVGRPREDKRKREVENGGQRTAVPSSNLASLEDGCLAAGLNEQRDSKKLKQGRKQIASDIESYSHQLKEIDENESTNDLIFSPNSKTYKSVREKKSSTKGRKTMRRSMSFSEGQATVIPVIHKSGYNEETSSKYNVVTNCGPAGNEKEKSKSDKIKELLDYAVSQQNIVIQASQALNLSLNGEEKKGCPEIIEGERLLLLASQRRVACLDEVESIKQPDRSRAHLNQESICPPCKATLVISEVKLPLNADFLVALRGGRMDLGVFHFVVLIQHGPTQIYSTKVRCTYDELTRNFLTFKDKITLRDVPHDFVLNIKVFGMHTKRATDAISRGKKAPSKESPGLMKNMFSSLTPKRRMNSADDSPVRGSSPKPVFRTTNFTAVGNANANLSSVNSGKFVLQQVPKNCPLDGFIEMKVDCLPEFTASARGFLTILEEVGGFTAWNRRWCVMFGDLISFWRFPDEENQKPPTATIDLRLCSNKFIDVVPRMECSRPNTFELTVKRPLSKTDVPSLLSTIEGKEIHTKYWVSADNKEDRVAWIEVLNRQLSDSKAWSSKQFKTKVSNGQNMRMTSETSARKQANAVAV